MNTPWHSYLLRVWYEPSHTPPQLRIGLRLVPNGEWRVFANWPALIQFLEQHNQNSSGSLGIQGVHPDMVVR